MNPRSLIRRMALAGLLFGPLAASATEVTVHRWHLHSSFLMCLHQVLMSDAARSGPREMPELTPDERAAWLESVEAYRAAGGSGDPSFTRPMALTTDALVQVADDSMEPPADAPLGEALRRAAPIYRRHAWEADDRANKFFIAYASAMLREAGEDLVRRHEAVYRTDWPERVFVYVTPVAGRFGAYTLTRLSSGVVTTMACRDEGYQGFRALEMLLHESSHAIVDPNTGTVAEAIKAAAKLHGVALPRNLWHAILFATSSELTRRELAARGVTTFTPSADDLLTRVWPEHREPIERFWIPYLEGQGTLEEAIDRIVAAQTPSTPSTD